MTETMLSLSPQEQEYLIDLLQRTLKERRIEEHRTRTPSYREYVLEEEEMIQELLKKLGAPVP